MIVAHNNTVFKLLGDPHLGRQFVNGVPLIRRGEREKMVWRDFILSFYQTAADYHVCMGDLFDKWFVPYDLIKDVAQAYIDAAKKCHFTKFVVLKGNHDWTRDLQRISAFDLFAELVKHIPNIIVVSEPMKLDGFIFIPYHPTKDTKASVQALLPAEVAFGHWDTAFSDHNLVPTGVGVPYLYTGHVHKKTVFARDGDTVVVVGSMQPYAHGEESDDKLYITMDKPEGDLHNKCVRLTSPSTEPVDCLQLTVSGQKANDDSSDNTTTLGNFDIEELFREAFKEAGVSQELTDKLLDDFQTKRVKSNA